MTQLYVHVPYCKKKCDYCNFYSKATAPSDDYVVALLQEAEGYEKQKIDTLYFGGGTPSLLSLAQFEKLFEGIGKKFDLRGAEISLECNPDTATREKLSFFKSLGVNRLSIGVQSLNDKTLKEIGRIHDRQRALKALDIAISLFDNVNADYMLGLPYQTAKDVKSDLSEITDRGVTHLSAYSLILEENSPLYEKVKKNLVLPDVDRQVDYYVLALALLEEKGLFRYEISNFAKKGYECKHNSAVWKFEDYIGLGPAAHSFYKGKRYYNLSDLEKYIKGEDVRVESSESLNEYKVEFIMLALRTVRGLIYKEYDEYFKEDFKREFSEALSSKTVKETCVIDDSGIRIKDEYFYVSNAIIEEIVEKYL